MPPKLPDALKIQAEALYQQPAPLSFIVQKEQYLLIRLTSDSYVRLGKNSIGIEQEFSRYLLHRLAKNRKDQLTLAQIYIILKKRFGESSPLYDIYKGSFLFPFFLCINKSNGNQINRKLPYLFTVRDYKGSLEFNLRRIIDPVDEDIDRHVYHEPFEDEFSRAEIRYFYNYFYGFILGFGEAFLQQHDCFFFNKIQAILSIYGYADGKFFEHTYKNEDEYHDAVSMWKQKQ